MHGFEYALAGLMISEGMIDEGLAIVRSVRDRYDGEKRNPWNEIECGSNYARSMASFSFLPIFAGFTFDMTKKHIGFAPITDRRGFRTIWSLDCGWGNVRFGEETDCMKIEVIDGVLPLKSIGVPADMTVNYVVIDGLAVPFTREKDGGKIVLAREITAETSVIVTK
jgi:hypothetical protein